MLGYPSICTWKNFDDILERQESMRLYKSIAILLFSIWMCAVAFAQQDRLEQLRQKVESQQQAIQQLEQQLGQQEQASTDSITTEYLNRPDNDNPKPIAGYNKGFFIQTPDGDWLLKINGYLRHHIYGAEAHAVQDNTYCPSENRLDLNVNFKKDWHARLRIDLATAVPNGNTQLRVREAYVEYLGIPSLKFRVGGSLVPFSMLAQTNPADNLAIVVPPYLTSYPVRDVGVTIFGDGIPFFGDEFLSEYVSYSFGVFNGEGETTLNANDDMMFAGEIDFFPFTNQERTVYCYVSSFFHHAPFREDGARIRLAGLQNQEVFEGLAAGQPNQNLDDTQGNQLGVSAGLRYWRDEVRFELEYVWIRYNRDWQSELDPLEMWGISAGLSYFFAMGAPDDHMGFEPLFRLSFTTLDDQKGDGSGYGLPLGTATDIRGQDVWEITFGAKLHFSSHLRMDFNWILYDLSETSSGLTNSDRGEGGGILHAFLFQFAAKW